MRYRRRREVPARRAPMSPGIRHSLARCPLGVRTSPGVFFFRRLHEREFAGHTGIDDPHEVGVHFPQFLDHLLGKGDGRAVLELQHFPSGEGALQVQDLEAAIHEFGGALLVAVEGSEGKEVRFDAEFGSEEGRKVVVSCPRIKNKMPAINADSATVTLSQSSDILGVTLEDAVEIILE